MIEHAHGVGLAREPLRRLGGRFMPDAGRLERVAVAGVVGDLPHAAHAAAADLFDQPCTARDGRQARAVGVRSPV